MGFSAGLLIGWYRFALTGCLHFQDWWSKNKFQHWTCGRRIVFRITGTYVPNPRSYVSLQRRESWEKVIIITGLYFLWLCKIDTWKLRVISVSVGASVQQLHTQLSSSDKRGSDLESNWTEVNRRVRELRISGSTFSWPDVHRRTSQRCQHCTVRLWFTE